MQEEIFTKFWGLISITYCYCNLSRNASSSQIKKAYRKLSLKNHPDKCKTEECKKAYIDIQDAYDCLSDDNKRRVYDASGEEGVAEREKQGSQQGFNPFDIFGFGGFGGKKRNQDMQATVPVTLEELYNGAEKSFNINREELCEHCHGTGADDPDHVRQCPVCKGSGVVLQRIQLAPGFVQQVQQPCSKCGGKGKIFDKACHVCHGKKLVTKPHKIALDVERGMKDGEQIVFEYEGNQHPDLDPGHVVIVLQQKKHRLFTRDGNDLKMNFKISLKDALLGWTNSIRHLDGHAVKFGKEGITKPGEVLKIEGEGMPVHNFPSQKGDLYITVTVEMPKSLSEEQKTAIANIF